MAVFVAVVIGIFVAYVGIALVVVLRSKDEKTREAHYRVFRDLLGLFQHKRS